MISDNKASVEHEIKWAILRFISHELRSPLNVICTGAKFAMEDINLDISSRLENLTDIYVAGETALGILEDIMSFEMGENGILELSRKFVSVSRVQRMLEGAPMKYACNKKIKLANDVRVESQPMYSELGMSLDERHMEQVFRNIITILSTHSSDSTSIDISIRHDDKFKLPNPSDPYTDAASPSVIQLLPKTQVIPTSNASRIPVPPQVIRESHPYPNKSTRNSECTVLDCGYVALEFAAACRNIPALDWGSNRPTELSLLKTDRLEGGGGVGLRLRIAQDIVQRHHGMLVLETEEEELDGYRRTSIKVYLPCSRRVLEGDSGQKVHSYNCYEDASTVRNIGGHADQQVMGFTVPPSSGIGAHSGYQSALLLDSSTGAGAPVELLRSNGSLVILREDSARQVPLGSGRGGTERRVVEDGDDEDDDDGGKDDVSGNRQMFSKRVPLPLSARISVNAGVLQIPSKPRMMRVVPATSFKARKPADSTPLEDIVAEYNS
eukprot:gene3327-4119_t